MQGIYGKDIGKLKCVTTRKKPAKVIEDYIEILRELTKTHCNMMMSVDGMNMNTLNFLTIISHKIFTDQLKLGQHE